jgi:hypothetical protein
MDEFSVCQEAGVYGRSGPAMNQRAVVGCFVAVVALAAACGGGEQPPTTPANPPASASEAPPPPPAPSASEAPPPPAPSASAAPSATAEAPPPPPAPPGPGEWDSWSHEKKGEYMKTVFAPKLGGMFHDFDAKTFAEPKCELCHGKGVKDGSFKMPNPDLPKLPTTEAGFKKVHDKKPQVVEFMIKVEQQSAQLLGEQPYDPKTKKGFSCFECHPKAK